MEPAPTASPEWTKVYPIFQAKCTDGGICHGEAQFPPHLVGEEALVKPAAESVAATIVTRAVVKRDMPRPPSPALPEEEVQAIQAWANSL